MWFSCVDSRTQQIGRTLRRLGKNLAVEYSGELARLGRLGEHPSQVESVVHGLPLMARARAAVAAATADGRGKDAETVVPVLRGLAGEIKAALDDKPGRACCGRRAMVRTLDHLLAAESALAPLLRPQRSPAARRILVPTDVLFQAYAGLFPAERMMVTAGRRTDENANLSATFDVTGDHHGGHVRADPQRLARALISMEFSGTYLAAWIHSHPGLGPSATHPSGTDVKQQSDWLRDYTPQLLGVIMVADGWLRFWGPAIERGQVELQFLGTGIQKGDSDEHVFRLVQQ